MFFFRIGLVCFECFNRMLKKQNESTHLVIPTSDMIALQKKDWGENIGLAGQTDSQLRRNETNRDC